MARTAVRLLRLSLGLACLALPVRLAVAQTATERVRFEAARAPLTPFMQRWARERGRTVERPAAEPIDGYLAKPAGRGPFPAVVQLHACSGLTARFRAGAEANAWADRLTDWGFAVLVVDSFTRRGVTETCSGRRPVYRLADAFGALAYLARQPFVDPHRIAVLGFSEGGVAALSAVEKRDYDLFDQQAGQAFRAAVAFYPHCASDGDMTAPTLVLIGALDDWTLASSCRAMLAKHPSAASLVRLVVYPDAYHSFDAAALKPGRRLFGHRLEYNPAAAEDAAQQVRRFLREKVAE
jgi:dienelactone hydrolase